MLRKIVYSISLKLKLSFFHLGVLPYRLKMLGPWFPFASPVPPVAAKIRLHRALCSVTIRSPQT